ncbi:MAG: hypothetical protein QXX41_07925 [Nitrososphaerota archaeon]
MSKDVDILKKIDEKLDAIIVNQSKQNTEIEELKNEILSLKKALLERFEKIGEMEKAEKPKKEWRQFQSGKAEWIPIEDCDENILKKLSKDRWVRIGDFAYRIRDDGKSVVRVRSGKK